MKHLAVFIAALLLTCPAFGQNAMIEITCKTLTNHIPADDVEYKPGVGADGKEITPADLNQGHSKLFEVIEIPIKSDFIELQDFNIDFSENIELETTLGTLSVFQDGRIELDGKDMTQEINDKCGLPPDQDGQVIDDSLKSGDIIREQLPFKGIKQ